SGTAHPRKTASSPALIPAGLDVGLGIVVFRPSGRVRWSAAMLQAHCVPVCETSFVSANDFARCWPENPIARLEQVWPPNHPPLLMKRSNQNQIKPQEN